MLNFGQNELEAPEVKAKGSESTEKGAMPICCTIGSSRI
jgi:hypothetical protein